MGTNMLRINSNYGQHHGAFCIMWGKGNNNKTLKFCLKLNAHDRNLPGTGINEKD